MASAKALREQQETQFARMIDDSLVYLSTCDVRLPAMDAVCCSEMAIEHISDPRLYTLPDDSFHAETLLSGHADGVRYILYSGRCVEFAVVKRQKSLGAIPSYVRSVMKIEKFDILKSGKVKRESHSAHLLQDRWSFDHEPSRSAGKTVRRTHLSGWAEYQVREIPVEITVMPAALISASLCRSQFWMVTFSAGLPQTISLPTDAIGVKEWFRMRDVPDGKSRRDALLHWVRHHFRKNRTDPETEHAVRRHMRGAREFDWFDMHCVITPHDDPKYIESPQACLEVAVPN